MVRTTEFVVGASSNDSALDRGIPRSKRCGQFGRSDEACRRQCQRISRLLALAGVILVLAVGDVRSQTLLPQAAFDNLPIESTSSRLARLDAMRNFPLEKISPRARHEVEYVLKKPTLYRRIIARDLECDPDLFLFLVRHPEVIVNIWELMGVTQMQVLRTGQHQLHVDDGQGYRQCGGDAICHAGCSHRLRCG